AASRRASTRGARKALDALARAHATGAPIPVAIRADAIREELATAGAAAARLRAWRSVTARPRTGPVVSFSGLDGSGKSSQAQALRDALLQLGYDVAVKWTRISYNPSLDVIAAPVKRVLRRGGGEGGDDE